MQKTILTKPAINTFTAAILAMGCVSQAEAITTVPISGLLSHVTDTVTANGSNSWTYDFTVHNDTTGFPTTFGDGSFYGGEANIIVDWELPYFTDMGITNIQSPTGWSFAIETIGTPNAVTGWGGVADWQTAGDPWKATFDAAYGSAANNPFNTHTQVLHWYNSESLIGVSGIAPQALLSGFSFDAVFGSGQAPYQASWNPTDIQTGDPSFPTLALPNSPSISQVPLPGALMLMLSGLVGVFGFSRKKSVK